jgi:exopolysaccharide biosynthesis polyprenyl glycosylphosphotransferase
MIKKIPKYKYLLAFFDYLLLLVSFFIAVKIRFPDSSLIEIWGQKGVAAQVSLMVAYTLIWIAIFQHFHLYKINVFLMIVDQIIGVFKSIGYGVIGLMVITFLLKGVPLVESRLIVAYFALISVFLITMFRIAVFRSLFMFLSENRFIQRKILIVGAGKSGQMMAANLKLDGSHGFNVVGFLDDTLPIGAHVFDDMYLLGKINDIKQIVEKYSVEEVLIVIDSVSYQRLVEILDMAQQSKAVVKVSSKLYDVVPNKVVIEKYLGVPVISMSQNNSNTAILIYKRIFDIVFSLLGLIVLAIPLSIIALLIKLGSKGPVIYKQTRIGRNGRPFMFYKFRSMYINNDQKIHQDFVLNFIKTSKQNQNGPSAHVAENGSGSVKKMVNDPRVTKIGRFLRRTSMDELPQLFNVLKGDMSLVGPRPCIPYEWEIYDEWHQRRFSITPGCTGLWQVYGRSAVEFNDIVILDLYYINNVSPLLDLKLILKTIPVMFWGRGAY